jgi:hypothetical protein
MSKERIVHAGVLFSVGGHNTRGIVGERAEAFRATAILNITYSFAGTDELTKFAARFKYGYSACRGYC